MEFPERELALTWVGRTLVDRDGTEIGACTAVFTDDATRVTEWVCSEVGGTAVFIPAVGATESGEQVQVAVRRDEVANAPAVGGSDRISDDEEAALYRHYGIPHSRDASSSLLPTGEPSEAAAEDLGTPASTRPQSAKPAPVAAEPDRGPTGSQPENVPAARDLHPVAEAGDGPSAPASSGRRRALPVAGGLAGVGMAVGAVLGLRRLRRKRPPTRTERILARGRAASSALSSGAGRVVRSPGRAGAVAAVPATALTLRALRRRRSGRDPEAG